MAAQVLLKWARGVLRRFEALGFGLVQVVWSCGRGQATEVAGGGWRNSGVGYAVWGFCRIILRFLAFSRVFLALDAMAGRYRGLRWVRLRGFVKRAGLWTAFFGVSVKWWHYFL